MPWHTEPDTLDQAYADAGGPVMAASMSLSCEFGVEPHEMVEPSSAFYGLSPFV